MDGGCKKGRETDVLKVSCASPKVISAVNFADFGLPDGGCDAGFKPGSQCSTPNLTAIVAKQCVGHKSCTLECSDYANLHQHGCNISADDGAPYVMNSTPDCGSGTSKNVVLAVACGVDKPCHDTKQPSFVSAMTSAYGRGKLGTFDNLENVSSDLRALENPDHSGSRGIGKLAEGVIIAVDIDVADQTREYLLAAYFVDWERQGREMSVSLLDANDDSFGVLAPSQVLKNFGGGVYLSWRVQGSVRIRVSHVGGDPGGNDAVLSAVFFDAAKADWN
jgi:hypothetical protein